MPDSSSLFSFSLPFSGYFFFHPEPAGRSLSLCEAVIPPRPFISSPLRALGSLLLLTRSNDCGASQVITCLLRALYFPFLSFFDFLLFFSVVPTPIPICRCFPKSHVLFHFSFLTKLFRMLKVCLPPSWFLPRFFFFMHPRLCGPWPSLASLSPLLICSWPDCVQKHYLADPFCRDILFFASSSSARVFFPSAPRLLPGHRVGVCFRFPSSLLTNDSRWFQQVFCLRFLSMYVSCGSYHLVRIPFLSFSPLCSVPDVR